MFVEIEQTFQIRGILLLLLCGARWRCFYLHRHAYVFRPEGCNNISGAIAMAGQLNLLVFKYNEIRTQLVVLIYCRTDLHFQLNTFCVNRVGEYKALWRLSLHDVGVHPLWKHFKQHPAQFRLNAGLAQYPKWVGAVIFEQLVNAR